MKFMTQSKTQNLPSLGIMVSWSKGHTAKLQLNKRITVRIIEIIIKLLSVSQIKSLVIYSHEIKCFLPVYAVGNVC